jgi:hypothetical protein
LSHRTDRHFPSPWSNTAPCIAFERPHHGECRFNRTISVYATFIVRKDPKDTSRRSRFRRVHPEPRGDADMGGPMSRNYPENGLCPSRPLHPWRANFARLDHARRGEGRNSGQTVREDARGRVQANKVIAIRDEKAHGKGVFDNGAEAGLLPRCFEQNVCRNADRHAAAHRAGSALCFRERYP